MSSGKTLFDLSAPKEKPESTLADRGIIAAKASSPPMSVLHLLIWIGLIAVMLGLWDWLDRLQPSDVRKTIGDWSKQPIGLISRTVSAIAEGATIGGVLM